MKKILGLSLVVSLLWATCTNKPHDELLTPSPTYFKISLHGSTYNFDSSYYQAGFLEIKQNAENSGQLVIGGTTFSIGTYTPQGFIKIQQNYYGSELTLRVTKLENNKASGTLAGKLIDWNSGGGGNVYERHDVSGQFNNIPVY